jgi:hypothetical protein
LVTRQDRKILDLVVARTATVRAIVTNERAIAEKKEVRVGIEEGPASVAPEAVEMPSIAR